VQGDFFSSDWENEICPDGQKFDLIYDYTASYIPFFISRCRTAKRECSSSAHSTPADDETGQPE
jgi:hypothetical protein